MKEPVWVEVPEAMVLHDMQLVAFGGTAGIRDMALLESALVRPRNIMNYESPKPSLARLAAAYAFGIIKNHPFVDGNKRTGLVVAFAFLELNGIEMNSSEEETYQVFIDLASGKLSENFLSIWIEENSAKADKSTRLEQ
jgi:death-on-curing protein